MKDKKPSEIIEDFLELLKNCGEEYKQCAEKVWKYDKMSQDQLHDIEFANNYDERCKISTRIHNERIMRRKYKDRVEMVEKITAFCSDKQNKQFIDRLRHLLKEQRKVEEYVGGERHYNRRVVSEDDTT